jgi:hypothetical protein
MALTDKLKTIADAIRSKTGSTEELTLDQMATEIEGISSGGGSASVAEKDVNFYDYDGTLLHSYTVEEAQALSELPALPEQPGLICQGWNWSLEDIKAHNRAVNVGATYITDDGTTRIYIHLEEGRTSPMLGVCPNGTVTVDWGDGTAPDVLTGTSTSTVAWTPTHEYAAPGDYVIRLTVDGEMGISSTNYTEGTRFLRHNASADNRNTVYRNAMRMVEIGGGVTSIGRYAFSACYSLKSITIPNGITEIDIYAFYYCYSLLFATIPNSVTLVSSAAFCDCYSLSTVAIPNSVTNFGSTMFSRCYALKYVTIPSSITSINSDTFANCYTLTRVDIHDGIRNIGYSAFSSCYSLKSITIPNSIASINQSAFKYCYSLASVTIPARVMDIKTDGFYGCYGVRFYDFTNHTAVPTLSNTNAFSSIAADCEIRVPAALYDEWIAATNWANYASKIVAV